MSDLPPAPHRYLGPDAVRSQIIVDVKEFSKTQVYPSLILAFGAFIYAWWTGQVTSFGHGLKFIVYSLIAGLLCYLALAIIRAPIIVIGWHLRQISSLNQRLIALPAFGGESGRSESLQNSFTDFRVISEQPLSLDFEVWYFYDGAIGEEGIVIYARVDIEVGIVNRTSGVP